MPNRFEPWDTIWEEHEKFVKAGLTFEQAIPAIKSIATSKAGMEAFDKPMEDWALVENADYTADKKTIVEWFMPAIMALADQPEANLIHTELGDCPQIFAPMLGVYTEIDPDEAEKTYYGDVLDIPFGDYITHRDNNELQAPMAEFLVGALLPRIPIPMDLGYFIWLSLANLAIAELLAQADLAQYLGDREAVHLTFGFEEAMTYGGSLTPTGWRFLDFIPVHRLQN